jgi:hypothetical protein
MRRFTTIRLSDSSSRRVDRPIGRAVEFHRAIRRGLRAATLLMASIALASCVISPPSRTAWDSRAQVTLQGFLLAKGQTVTIKAMNQNTGNLDLLGTTTSLTSGMPETDSTGTTYTLYPWSWTYTMNGGVLPTQYWSPQDIASNLMTAQGHAELIATTTDGIPLATFSPGAAQAAQAAMPSGGLATGAKFSDGQSTVLFDQYGVGSGEEGGWTNQYGMTAIAPASSPPGFLKVAWSVGYYTVQGGTKIAGLICAPTTGGPYPVVIYNHGGIDTNTVPTNGDVIGITSSSTGWSIPPSAPAGQSPPADGLGQCIDWAKRGWVFATSAYRGEKVTITTNSGSTSTTKSWPSQGGPEFCMGEVTDVMALTDLLLNSSNTIQVGATGATVTPNVNPKQFFMYGYSHGGCITYRAVEQGAPVTAFSVIEGFTDLSLNYLNWTSSGQSTSAAATNAGAVKPGGNYFPDTNGVMGYNWRSAHYFASRGDLTIQRFKAMPILIFHGDVNAYNPVFLDEPTEIATDIGATDIFVGPTTATAPGNQLCIAGPVGAPFKSSLLLPGAVPNATCPVAFKLMDQTDSCFSSTPDPGPCAALALPLTPAAGQPVQQHYLVVYHAMDHVFGGAAINATFDQFVQQNYAHQAGCNGVLPDPGTPQNCNND